MENLQKEFVPYEVTLKMKELGFDEPCFGWYENNELVTLLDCTHPEDRIEFIKVEEISKRISAPTLSQSFKFFREKYKLSVLIHDCLDDYIGEIVEWTLTEDKIIHEVPNRIKTYEEAELACLEKLMQIVEHKTK
jgi:hypothetical protein